jgi:hypothetical protein
MPKEVCNVVGRPRVRLEHADIAINTSHEPKEIAGRKS